MTWIKTSWIEVPAHANQTTEVSVNEWFFKNRSFLLGTPVANQLRGTAGGWAQTCAIAPTENQDTVSLLRDRLSQILKMAKGDVPPSPSQSINEISPYQKSNTMATVIPSDKFESNSSFAFILRENPKASGIEIHFPPDAIPDPGFIGRVVAAGFLQAHSNPSLWYHKQYTPELMAKARGWVKACQKHGAYEIDPSEPVEKTKSRRRGTKQAASPTPTPTPASATPVVGNKIVDAIAERVQEMLNTMKEELAVKPDTSELDGLRAENERLRRDMERLRQEHERMETTISQQREAIDVAVAEVARLGEVVEERDRVITSLRQQLAEWGVVEVESEPGVPVFDDESEAPVFDDEPPVFDDEQNNSQFGVRNSELDDSDPIPNSELTIPNSTDAPNFDDEEVVELGEPPLPSSSEPEPDDTSEVEGFDLDSLGEL